MKKDFRVLLLYPNESLQGVAPASLGLLSAFLKNDGFDVKLFETTVYVNKEKIANDKLREKLGQVKKSNFDEFIKPKSSDMYEDFINLVNEYKPNLIGISLIDGTIKYGLSFIEKIKHLKIPIITGGVGTTFNYKKILDSGLVNYVCIGEGELALLELANKLYSNEDTLNIKNIYTLNPDGSVHKNPLRPPIDLDSLPIPDFDIYEDWRFYRPFMGNVRRMIQIDTDRGCPFNCTYCAAPGLRKIYKEDRHNYFRIKGTDKLFEEITFLVKKYDIDFLWISSETFMARSEKKFKEFAERYIKEIGLPFWTSNRLDTFTPEKTRLLAEMGCKAISVGVEHGSEIIRNTLLNKNVKNSTIIDAIKLISKYPSMVPSINNMIGIPDETRETIFETIELNREIISISGNNHTMTSFIFVPFTGTQLRELCIEKGYLEETADLPASFFEESLLVMPTISKQELKGLERVMMLYIILPKSYWPDIRIAETDDEMFNKLMDLIRK